MMLFWSLARIAFIRMQFTIFPSFHNSWHFKSLLGTIWRQMIPVATVQKSLFVYVYEGEERELLHVFLKCWLWYVNPQRPVYFYGG